MSGQPQNEAFGNFGLPNGPASSLRPILAATATGAWALLATLSVATYLTARKLAFQPALGAPLLRIGSEPLYAPWKLFEWLSLLDAAPDGTILAESTRQSLHFCVAVAVLIFATTLVARVRAGKNRIHELHGSASFASPREIKATGLLAGKGVIVGRWVDAKRNRIRYLRHDGPEHILAFAPSRSGKGVGLVLPTLLTWQESVFVLDIKGENYKLTSGYRHALGHRVYRVDFGAKGSARFNPLATVRIGTHHEVADAQRIADILTDPNGKQGEKHWAVTAHSLLTGAIVHVLYREAAKGRTATLYDVASELTDRHRSHEEVLQSWLDFPHDPKLECMWLDDGLPTHTHATVASAAREQLNREERERNAVLSSAIAPFGLFRDPTIVENTSSSDFEIEDLVTSAVPTAVYFVLSPADKDRLVMLARMFIDLLLRRLTEEHHERISSPSGRSEATTGQASLRGLASSPSDAARRDMSIRANSNRHRLLLMLDEFPTLGKLSVFASAMGFFAGYGLKAFLIVQDYEQLIEAYGAHQSISSNCHISIAYAAGSQETAKRLSDMTGTVTAIKRTRSGGSIFGPPGQRQVQVSEQEISRPLLTPDECRRIPGPKKEGEKIVEAGDMLVFVTGRRPIYGRQALFFRDLELLRRSQLPCPPSSPEAESRPKWRPPVAAEPMKRTPLARDAVDMAISEFDPIDVGEDDDVGEHDHENFDDSGRAAS
ncbi:MAG: hypothetical protein RL385_4 [Pseudomonadota bacterium]|jgi:type IV secretion system protein VirD4